jgi:predicted Zn-dependent protease
MRPFFLAACVALAALCSASALPGGAGQEPAAASDADQATAERALERFQAYLKQKPFHDQGFERLVAAAVELNALGRIVAELEARVAAAAAPPPPTATEPEEVAEVPPDPAPDGATDAERVLLARLYARTDRTTEALEVLDALITRGAPSAHGDDAAERTFALALRRLRGELLVTVGEVERGLAELDAVATALTADAGAPSELRGLEALHTERAEAALRLGDRARAARAFDDLARVDPTSFDLALDVAERLARASLLDEATLRYGAALTLAGDEAPRRCRALAAFGELHERRADPAAALSAYDEAFDLLGRGHWLKRQLELRIVAVHTREGTLTTLASELRAALETRRDDLDRRTLLARVEVALKDLPAARATLEAARTDFPRDLALGRELLDVLALAKDDDARVAELQRLVAEHPAELELYIELGQVLASSGRLEQARRQWQRTLEGRLQDPGLCLRLASLHARSGLVDEALDLVERALVLEPAELGHYDELARLLKGAGRHGEVDAALARAEVAAGNDPTQLETLATIATAHRDEARAGRVLERALAAAPHEPRVRRALAEHARRTGDTARAATLLRELVASADAATARDAAQRLLRLRRSELNVLQRETEAQLAAAPDDRAALYIAALVSEERRQYPDALGYLERLLVVDPRAEHAAVLAAQLHERLGDDEAAVARYRALIELEPRQRGRWLNELGRLHQRLGDPTSAVTCFDEALRLAPDNPAVFREVARAFEAMSERAHARECLRQVLRLRPDDGDSRLALASLLVVAPADEEPRGKEQAEELALTVARGADAALAKRGREWLYERLEERGEVQATVERLRAELKQNPFDTHRPLELVDLFVREDEYELALELLDELLAYRPNDAALLRERAELHRSMQRYDAALADYAALQRLPDVERDEALLLSAKCLIQAGDLARADELLDQVGERMDVYSLYRREKLLDRALAVLEAELERTPEDIALLERLVGLHQDRGDAKQALAAFERGGALTEETPERLRRRAQLLRTAGDQEGYIAVLVQSLLAIEPPVGPAGDAAATLSKSARRALRDETRRVQKETNALRSQLSQAGDWHVWTDVAHRAAVAAPLREEFINPAFSGLVDAERYDEAAALVENSRAELQAGRCPVGLSKERWKRTLDARDKLLVRTDPRRAAARAEELAAALERDAGSLTPERIRELAALYEQQDDDAALLALYEVAAQRFPKEPRYGAAAAVLYIEQGDETSALPFLQALLSVGGLPTGSDPLRPNRKDRERLEARLPATLVPLVTDEHVARKRRLEAQVGFDGHWAVATRPNRMDVEIAVARCLVTANDRDGARALLAGLEPTHPEHTSRGCFVAQLYSELGFEDDAERMQDAALRALEAAASEPVLCASVSFRVEARALMTEHARALVAAGEVARGFELARRWGGVEAAQGVLRSVTDRGPLRAELEALWNTARAAPPAEDRTGTLDRGVLLLDVLVQAGDWDAAAVVADELATLAPTAMSFTLLASELDRKRGDTARARTRLEAAIIAVTDEVRRTGVVPQPVTRTSVYDGSTPAPQPLVGLAPPRLEGTLGPAREIVGQTLFLLSPPGQVEPEEWRPWELEAELCDLAWAAASWAEAAERLERLFAAAPAAASWFGYLFQERASNVPADASSLPLWELVYEQQPDEFENVASYGTALEAAGRVDDALRTYRKFVRANSGDDSTRELEQRIVRLDPASAARTALPADLAAAVTADPKNVALRRALVQQLLGERRYTDAAEHALALEQLAPHLGDVLELCEDALLLARRDDLYVERVRKRLPSIQDDDMRIERSVRAATILDDRGDRAGAEELLRLGFAGTDPGSGYTSAGFWLSRGEKEAALGALEASRKNVAEHNPWLADEIDAQLARLRGEAESQSALDPERLAEYWREQGPGSRVRAETLEELSEFVRTSAGELEAEPDPAAAAVLEAHATTLSGARAVLVSAVALLARGDRAGFEERLVELGTAPRADRAFARAAVDSARERGAYTRAAELLQRLALAAPPRARREVMTPVGALPERAALEIELGALELAAAEDADPRDPNALSEVREAVLARWRAALAEHPEPLLVLTYTAGFEDAAREALVALEAARAAARAAARTPTALPERVLFVATALARASNDVLGAYERLMESERIAPAGPLEARTALLVDVARECGKLNEVRDLALQRHGQEPTDAGLAGHVLRLVAELDGPRAALALAQDWPAGDESWLNIWRPLAARTRALAALARDEVDTRGLRALERRFIELTRDSSPDDFEWSEERWRLTELMLDMGEHDAVRSSFARLDARNANHHRTNTAHHLQATGHLELALELIAPLEGSERSTRQEISLLLELGRLDEAHRCYVEGVEIDPERARAVQGTSTRAKLRAAPVHAARLADARAALAGALEPTARIDALGALATLERLEHDDAAARLATLEELARLRPQDARVRAWLVEDWLAVGRYTDALAAIEEQLEDHDRRHATALGSEREPDRSGTLLRQRARALVGAAEGAPSPGGVPGVDPSALLATLNDRLGRRFSAAAAQSYMVYGLDRLDDADDERGLLLWSHGLAVEAHGQFWKDTQPDPERAARSWSASLRAALMAGDTELALDRAFAALRDGAAASVEACAPVFGRAERLGDLERRLDVWVAESRRELAASPAALDEVLERATFVRRAIAEQRDDHAALVTLARERALRRAWDPGAHELLAESLLRAGEYEAALGAANHAAGLRERAVLEIVAPGHTAELARWSPAAWEAGGPVRFGASGPADENEEVLGIGGGSFGAGTAGIVWSEFTHGESVGPAATVGPDLRAELLFLTGRRDEALALEALRVGRAPRGADDPRIRVAADYARHGVELLEREAERLLLAVVFSGSQDAAGSEGGALALERLAELAQRRGDHAAAERSRAEASARRGPATLQRSDSAADARSRGLAALDAGDSAGALALLDLAEAHERRQGTWNGLGAAHAHGLAQARAAVHGLAAARLDLVCALAEHPRHERATRTRELLQSR